MTELEIVYRDPRELRPYGRNARVHPPEQIAQIRASIAAFGFNNPALLREDEITIGAGHGRVQAACAMIEAGERLPTPDGIKIPTATLRGLSDEQWRGFIIADNRLAEGATWDFDLLKVELGELAELGLDIGLTGFALDGLGNLGLPSGGSGGTAGQASGALKERFGVVPFSVLNAREGWWQDRKKSWLSLGIKSELGRGENLLKMSETMLEPDAAKRAARKANAQPAGGGGGVWAEFNAKREERLGYEGAGAGTSIFDPVLCELAYRWWSPQAGLVLDPFAGGSVRGIVAGKTGRHYVGVDLRPEQVEANRAQAAEILGQDDGTARWIEGDSAGIRELVAEEADFIFSCPPYADLERYNDDERDLSTMEYPAFLEAYGRIIAAAARKLRKDRFAAFVVGEVRGSDGNYRGFVPATIAAFERAGLRLYNEAILVTAAGTLPMRAGKQFAASGKLGKTHQNVLVFLKGDAKRAIAARGPVEFGDFDAEADGDQTVTQGATAGSPPGATSAPTPFGEKLLSLGGEV